MTTALTTSNRAIVYRTLGSKHGPITRLMSPSDLGERLKPFVFLDHFEAQASSFPSFGMHPHSSIATLTWMMQGSASYEDTTGKTGLPPAGHTVAWAALSRGTVSVGELADAPMAVGEMVVFDQSAGGISFKALEDAEFVIGSAVQHAHELVLGRYSVHTSPEALQQGEATIKQMGVALATQRRLQK